MSDHQFFIRETNQLAEKALRMGNPPFGALLEKDGNILLTATNTIQTDKDLTAHAEANLIRMASKQLDPETLSKCTLYASTEPCVLCAGAIFFAGITRVVFSCSAQTFYQQFAKYMKTPLLIPCREVFEKSDQRSTEVIGPILEEESLKVLHKYYH